MIHYKIVGGKYAGLIGSFKGRLGVRYVLFVQSRDQWFLAYEKPENIKLIFHWELVFVNGSNYVRERKL
jgi:hypothetical protein